MFGCGRRYHKGIISVVGGLFTREIGVIPYDEQVAAASQAPESPLDSAPGSAGVVAIEELVTKLSSIFLN